MKYAYTMLLASAAAQEYPTLYDSPYNYTSNYPTPTPYGNSSYDYSMPGASENMTIDFTTPGASFSHNPQRVNASVGDAYFWQNQTEAEFGMGDSWFWHGQNESEGHVELPPSQFDTHVMDFSANATTITTSASGEDWWMEQSVANKSGSIV